MSRPRILFCIACGRTYGIGHLKRCLDLIHEGSALFDSRVCIVKGGGDVLSLEQGPFAHVPFVDCVEDAGEVDLIVSDMRDTEADEIPILQQRAPVLSIDDCGAGSNFSSISIHSLPTIEDIHGNFNGQKYLILGSEIKEAAFAESTKESSVLVSFGGSDPYNLSAYITSVLNTLGISPVVITGPLFQHGRIQGDCKTITTPRNMHDLIRNAKVLITSFGITMFESFYLKTPVILFNHSQYHWKLANKVPVINLGYYQKTSTTILRERMGEALEDKEYLLQMAERNASLIDGHGTERVISIIMNAIGTGRKGCLFNHRSYTALKRTETFTLFQCSRCNDLFLFSVQKQKGEIYSKKEYFLSEYEKQYGRSYLEDKENIVRMAQRRLGIIERSVKKKGTILDIGCAMGFFLELARERGWETRGVEISRFASDWARKNLSLEIITGSFLDTELKPESFDVITLFFVAEHFQNVEKVIEKVYVLLKYNGLLVMALPNRRGISYLMNRAQYIAGHPRDHYFDTSVRNLTKFLKGFGFQRKKMCITGIHPERFFTKIGIRKDLSASMLFRVYLFAAHIFRLGDTFEYYGSKKDR